MSSPWSSPTSPRPIRAVGTAMPSPPGGHSVRGGPPQSSPRSTSSTRRVPAVGGLPPPPPLKQQSGHQSQYTQSLAKSMTIDEMRQLHQRALRDAEAKRTELRLVLASRYRELVGSSDEVLRMRERSQELHELVNALPSLVEKLVQSTTAKKESTEDEKDESKNGAVDHNGVIRLRRDLSDLPRVVHRALDKNDVHTATTSLIQLFSLIASQTDAYPLAMALAPGVNSKTTGLDPAVEAQMRMVFLHVQTLPANITRLSKRILLQAASYGDNSLDPSFGARTSAAALSSLDLLDINQERDRAVQLLDLYYDSKAKLLQSLLSQLSVTETPKDEATPTDMAASNAEEILSKIVLILQYDVVVHPYQVFCLRRFPVDSETDAACIVKSLPQFDANVVKSKASKFLAAHLPLIRTKVKSVLVTIAGTSASALGKIRQSLYDKTDGEECIKILDSNGVCTWEEAVNYMVDVRTVLTHGSPEVVTGDASARRFSLWSALFSNTFSSLVHSLLTTSFHSVHARVVSTLRTSLANAPPIASILPHEAYRNTLQIATELDKSLLKVSEDAHELLVHAEEREESERRLRQSLYVQTCEIMGRLICELRRMLAHQGRGVHEEGSDATKELIVGRLCHLLKFRLTALPTLLNPKSSPAFLLNTSGMITLLELQSAFELADHDEDGLITFEEAMEAVESAFSGTQYHGAEMVRETLLIPSSAEKEPATPGGAQSSAPKNVTLNELVLLAARGLRHEAESALGTIQKSLDAIIESCFQRWANAALQSSSISFSNSVWDFLKTACVSSESEWKRMYSAGDTPNTPVGLEGPGGTFAGSDSRPSSEPIVGNVSPHVVGFILKVSSLLNHTICPSDSLVPVPSLDYAASMGVVPDKGMGVASMMETVRLALLREALCSAADVVEEHLASVAPATVQDADTSEKPSIRNSCPSSLIQFETDISFMLLCFVKRNKFGFGAEGAGGTARAEKAKHRLEAASTMTCQLLIPNGGAANYKTKIDEKHKHVIESCDLFISSLFGEDSGSQVSATTAELDLSMASGVAATPLLHNPLPSTRRFVLLPVQSDRSLSELQLRGKYGKEKDETDSRQDSAVSGVMSSGLGFFSSMLKKK